MLKFIAGILFGIAMSIAYVWFDVSLPRWMQLPETLRNNLVSTATEADLYALDGDADRRRRALEVYFAYRAPHAAEIDAENGHPFLMTLYRQRAAREARLALSGWQAFDEALAKPALRTTFERRFGTTDPQAIKQHLLAETVARKPFLTRWLERPDAPPKTAPLRERLHQLAAR